MKKQKFILCFMLILSTCFIFFFSHFTAKAYESFISDDRFNEHTSIGPVDVSNKTREKAEDLLTNELNGWRSSFSLNIQFKEKSISVPSDIFQFNINKSVTSAIKGKKNELKVDLKNDKFVDVLSSVSPMLSTDKININKLQSDLLGIASTLLEGENDIYLENYLLTGKEKDDIIHEITLDTSNQDLLEWKIQNMPMEFDVPAESQFSLIHALEDSGAQKTSPALQNVLASGIYQLILNTNFTIIERHIGMQLPPYADLGFEASVNREKNKDLIFSNVNKSRYSIIIKKKGSELTFQLRGIPFLYDYRIRTTEERHFKPKTVRQYSSFLNEDQYTVQEDGKEGLFIKIYREIYDENGSLMKEDFISEDYYPPVYRVEVYGVKGINETTVPSNEEVNQTDVMNQNANNNGTTGTDGNEQTASSTPETKESDIWGKPNEAEK